MRAGIRNGPKAGVVECWSTGAMDAEIEALTIFGCHQHANTPLLQYSCRLFGKILQIRNFGNEMPQRCLFEVNDLAAVVLTSNDQARFAAVKGAGDFSQNFLGGVVDFAQVGQNDVLKAPVLQFTQQLF